MEQFIERSRIHFSVDASAQSNPVVAAQLRLTALASFQAEFTFHLSDFEATTRRLSERAFSHLQRSIVADPVIGGKWRDAYQDKRGEDACEKLGAAHLLGHGIWAFKGHAPGERTDLIMGDRLIDLSEVQRSAEAMVLTEWKLVPSSDQLSKRAEDAYKQARRYTGGSLVGFELAGYRYLVLVSEDFMETGTLERRQEDGVVYQYVNIAVNPRTPSGAKGRYAAQPGQSSGRKPQTARSRRSSA